MIKRLSLPVALAWAGALPFVATMLLILAGVNSVPLLGAPTRIMALYGIVIAVFMAGTHWGHAITRREYGSKALLVESNVVTVVLLAIYLIAPGYIMFALIAAFLVLLAVDGVLDRQGHLSQGYFLMRVGVTCLVCLCLLVGALVAPVAGA
ncbi:DUF3429 domain-containing protein [Pararhizobium mangrovi]|uniref:DUF3429 domain-containing protein n=1 Tax=Pararhizobium mangrovi TaxID=2590452 RepID=A0A506UBV2_9HYPH|nr:DUF3429 domain-containing protein [Pararhizobium mangrovi]TPW29267.1 DUF3429 domain-containing protein [Pararhizobium mangrovi]